MAKHKDFAQHAGFFAKGVGYGTATVGAATATTLFGVTTAVLVVASPTVVVIPFMVLTGGATAASAKLTFKAGRKTINNFEKSFTPSTISIQL